MSRRITDTVGTVCQNLAEQFAVTDSTQTINAGQLDRLECFHNHQLL